MLKSLCRLLDQRLFTLELRHRCHYHDEIRSFFHPSHLLHHGIWFNIDLWFSSNRRPGRCVFLGYTNACADSAECRCVRPSRCGASAAGTNHPPWCDDCYIAEDNGNHGNHAHHGHQDHAKAIHLFLAFFFRTVNCFLKVRLAIGCLSLQENLGKACLPFHRPPRGALVES